MSPVHRILLYDRTRLSRADHCSSLSSQCSQSMRLKQLGLARSEVTACRASSHHPLPIYDPSLLPPSLRLCLTVFPQGTTCLLPPLRIAKHPSTHRGESVQVISTLSLSAGHSRSLRNSLSILLNQLEACLTVQQPIHLP